MAAIQRRHEEDKQALSRLYAIDKEALSEQQQLNYDLYKWQLEMAIDEHQFQSYLMQVNQRGGVQTLDNFANYVPLESVADYERWLSRLEALPTLVSCPITHTVTMPLKYGTAFISG